LGSAAAGAEELEVLELEEDDDDAVPVPVPEAQAASSVAAAPIATPEMVRVVRRWVVLTIGLLVESGSQVTFIL
jgi:hypothetical protein